MPDLRSVDEGVQRMIILEACEVFVVGGNMDVFGDTLVISGKVLERIELDRDSQDALATSIHSIIRGIRDNQGELSYE